MRRLASLLFLASLTGCKFVSYDASALDSDMLASYDASRLTAGDWAEYATHEDGDEDPAFVLRYSCVAVEPGTAWVEMKSSRFEEVFVLALDPATGAVRRGWKAKPGEPAKELWVKSIGEPGGPPPVPAGHSLDVETAPAVATLDGKSFTGALITTKVHNTTEEGAPVEETIAAVYAVELPFPIAWSRTPQGKGPAGGLATMKRTNDDGMVETKLVGFGHDAKRTVTIK